MAAIPTTTPHPSASARRRATKPLASFVRALHALIAVACLAGGVAMAAAYPIAQPVALIAFVAWAAFAFARFPLALPSLIALVPAVGFALYTGWLTFEETDLLVLATAAGGHAALALRHPAARDSDVERFGPKLSIFSIALVALFVVSLVIGVERGIAAAGGFRFDWFQTYDDPLNSVRILKSFVWATLMTPLLLDELRRPGAFDRLGMGLVAALAIESLFVLQERLAFTGLLDFSEDYRVTGSFWEMHVGGAALDGFLALTIPFAVREIIRNTHRWRYLVALGTLGLAGYALFVTFSRAVYIAIPVSLLVLAVLVLRQRVRLARGAAWALLGKGIAFGLLVAACGFVVFKAGGYRAVLAAFVVLGASIPAENALRRTTPGTWVAAALAAVIASALGYGLAALLPKGPYVVFAIATAACAAATIADAQMPTRTTALGLVAAWLWLAVDACLVALHWGGTGAFVDAGLAMTALVVLAFVSTLFARPMWPERRHEQVAALGLAALVMGSIAVFTAGAYMSGRFSASQEDLNSRLSHWTEGLSRLHGTDAWLFGRGLGRFPAISHIESVDTMSTGRAHLQSRDGESFLALTGPRLRFLGFDELFRVTQRVAVKPDTTYVLSARARSSQESELHVELCDKHLLYHGVCTTGSVPLAADAKRWTQMNIPLRTGSVGASTWPWIRPVSFAMSNGNPNTVVEVDSVHLIGPDGIDLLTNGDFAQRTAHWFTSSDKFHLPWHIKNLALGVLFDQGVVGLALFVLLLGGAFVRTAFGRAYRHPDAPYIAAAISGYAVVGASDTLLDVPRVAFLFFLLVVTGLMLRNPRAIKTAAAIVPTPNVDEAAARSRRRQQAFGERRPASDG